MKTTLSVLLLLLLLAALAVILATQAQAPTLVTLTWGSTTVTTPESVALLLLIMGVLCLFYIGKLASWFGNLPGRWSSRQANHAHQVRLAELAQGLVEAEAGHMQKARKLAKKQAISPHHTPEDILTLLLHLKTGLLTGQQAEAARTTPTIGPLVALSMAQTAAQKQNWAEVRRITTPSLSTVAPPAGLLTLHFKALMNLQDPAAAACLPLVRPLLGESAFTLLSNLVHGLTPLQARQLDHVWVKQFQAWLPTPSDTFPVFHSDL